MVGEYTLHVVVGVSSEDAKTCTTFGSDGHTFQVVPTNETLLLDEPGTNHACNICGFPNAEASSSLVLHPSYSLELPCEEWQLYGVEGRLTPDACNFILKDPGLAANCGCRHGNDSSSVAMVSITWSILFLGMIPNIVGRVV